ncbi:MAG: phosphogluconate dehydrogenase (NAD(+)-dependent, decarboxylating) [Steroidobacter sp.]
MQMAMIGLGRMGADMVRRLMRNQHKCVVFDVQPAARAALAAEGAVAADSIEALVKQLAAPRVVWLMLPAAIVPDTVAKLTPLLQAGDIIVDGGNSDYRQAIHHAQQLKPKGIEFVDVGTSGGVWGLREGYCLMAGASDAAIKVIAPLLAALAQGEATPDSPPQTRGWLHCGPVGSGHFVKMVHNGIEYAIMAAYAEGFNLLAHADRGLQQQTINAETAPLDHPEHYQFKLDVPAIAEVWRHGSVVRSWLLDLAANALHEDPQLQGFAGRVSDSGEGRWTLHAAIDLGVPMPTLSAALFERFDSQGQSLYANRLLSALRKQFGGHQEQKSHDTK